MRNVFAFTCALAMLMTTAAHAQHVATSFTQLQVLVRPGDTVYITDASDRPELKAQVLEVTASSLAVSIGGNRREFIEGTVTRIRRRLPDSRKNGAVMGFLAGSALYVTGAKTLESPDGSCKCGCLTASGLTGGGLGALVGLGIDALTQGKRDIYVRDAAKQAQWTAPGRRELTTFNVNSVTLLSVSEPLDRVAPKEASSGARAGAGSDDFASLQRRLKSGDSVVVTYDDETRVMGRVVTVSGDRMVVTTDAGTREIAAGRVSRIQLRRNGVWLGTLIGAAAGVPFGFALRSYAQGEGDNEAGALALPIAAGTGAGLGLDALLVRPRTVFERRIGSRARPSLDVTRLGAGVITPLSTARQFTIAPRPASCGSSTDPWGSSLCAWDNLRRVANCEVPRGIAIASNRSEGDRCATIASCRFC